MADAQTREAFLRLVDAIQRRKAELTNFPHGDAIDFTLDESRVEFLNGEEGAALEMLVENLYEVRLPITSEIYDALAQLAQGAGLPPKRWLILRDLTGRGLSMAD